MQVSMAIRKMYAICVAYGYNCNDFLDLLFAHFLSPRSPLVIKVKYYLLAKVKYTCILGIIWAALVAQYSKLPVEGGVY